MKKLIAMLILGTLTIGCGGATTLPDTDAMAADAAKEAEAEQAKMEAEAEAEAKEAMKMDLVDTAAAAGTFTTLVSALTAAELNEALKAEGPYTVFAPTDEAFKKLPEGTVADLLKPENKEKLKSVLKFHVVAGKVMAADVKTMEVETLSGAKANVVVAEDGMVTFQGANVTATDIDCTNGVIHVIDSVAMAAEKVAVK